MQRNQYPNGDSPRRHAQRPSVLNNTRKNNTKRDPRLARCITETLESRRLFASTLLINETFASSADAADVTTVDGRWEVSEGALRVTDYSKASTSHLNNRAVHQTKVDGDFNLTVDASVPNKRGSGAVNDVAVIFGYQDRSNYYYFSLSDNNDNTTGGLFKVVGGKSTQIDDVSSRIAIQTTYQLRVERSGNEISAYRNGTLVASAIDSTFMGGAVGVGAKSNPGVFDNLRVTVPLDEPEPQQAPAAPTKLTAVLDGGDHIDLAWVDNSDNETGFKVESYVGGAWTLVDTIGVDATGYVVNDLTPATTYQFRVRAYNAAGESAASNTASATTPSVLTAPGAPTDLAANAHASDHVDLVWVDNSDNEAGFKVEQLVGGAWSEIATVDANSTAYEVGGLDPVTTYQFRVRAYNDIGNSAYSNTASATTPALPAPPAAPSNFTATADGASRINLAWVDNSDNETGFKVEYNIDGNWSQIATVDADATQYALDVLAAGTTYEFRIRAYNEVGDSAYSNVASATTAVLPPAAPSALTATAVSSTQVDLAWTDASDNEGGFKIERSSDNGATWTAVATVAAGATTYAATDLTAATAYQFRVRAYNEAGESAYSNTASATTAPAAPKPAISEDFANGAANFTVVDGAWALAGGGYGVAAENNAATKHLNSRVVHNTAMAGDFVLTVDAQVQPARDPWANAAVIFGYQDPSNYYFFSSNQSNDAGTNGIFKVVNGVSTELADAAATITPGVTYQLRVERSGDAIKAYRDGVLVASATDATFAGGLIGLGSRQFQAAFDNLAVVGEAVAPPTEAPAAPSNLTATAASSSSVDLAWTDNATTESGFKVERSSDNGATWTQVASLGANVKQYAATGLEASASYQFRVRAFNAAGDSAYSNTAGVKTPALVLVSPPQAAVNAAIAAPLIRYSRTLPGGAHTDGAWNGGASITLALASYAGNTTADARLLQQMRFTLTGGNDISANGGYPAQHERHVTGMFTLAKLTPRVWSQLTTAEQHKANLLMKAALAASAFTTSDNNPYIKAGQAERALDGDTNLGRDWNPNYREGMVGGMLVGAAYFGPAQAQQILDTYDHQAFVSELAAAGLSNIHQTFNWKQANPASIAPDAATIQQGVRNYRYYGNAIGNLMGIYGRLATFTYGKTVTSGLNGGAGVNGGGKIATGAETLPNKGATGMLTEFDSVDGSGPRSAANYAYDGYRPHQTNLLVLIASGHWDANSTVAADAKARLEIGNTDLWYKMDKGYIGYYHGAVRENFSTATHGATWGFTFSRSTWENVLKPYLNGQTNPPTTPNPTPTAPAAPTNLAALVASSTLINLTWVDNSSDEAGFKLERSGDNGATWQQVATLGAGVTAYAALNLTPATAYQFRVRAYNAAGDSAYSNTAGATTAPLTPTEPTPKPAISEDFANGAANFAVVDGPWGPAAGAFRVTGDNNAPTTHLNSRVVHNTGMAGDFVLTVDATPLAAGAPWANAAVLFGYQDPSNYYFFSSNQSNDAGTNGIFRVVNGQSIELADAVGTVTPGVTYQLRVERSGNAIKAYRDGALVASATDGTFAGGLIGLGSRQFQAAFDNLAVVGEAVAPPTEAPAAPSALVATASSSTSVNLAWTDNATTESGFKVERSTNGGSTWQQVASVGANVKQYAVGGLTASTAYQFRVRAFNVVGDSAYSNTATATTPAAPVFGVKPDATNTGPNNPGALLGLPVRAPSATGAVITAPGTYSGFDFTGSITVAADNVVLENFVLRNGEINVNGRSNVTIRNFRILGGSGGESGTNIRADLAVSNILIEHGEITNANSGSVVYGRNFTARYLYIHDTAGDVFRPVQGNVTIEHTFVTRIGVPHTSAKHADGIQSWGLNGLVMRYNNFDVGTGPGVNSAVNVDTNTNMIMEYNWFNGGGYTVGVGAAVNGNNVIRHNKWGRGFAFGAVYPPNANAKAYILWQDNVYEDNGQAVPW